jgi:hypothetical protein
MKSVKVPVQAKNATLVNTQALPNGIATLNYTIEDGNTSVIPVVKFITHKNLNVCVLGIECLKHDITE